MLTDRRATRTSRAELFRALGVFAEQPGPAHPRLAGLLDLPVPSVSDWTEGFVVQLVPYASIYLGTDGMLGGEPADRVAGFWRALRLPVPSDPDHLTALLGLYASLLDSEASELEPARRLLWRQARTALLHEHLLSWLLPYAHGMADAGPEPYAHWAGLLAEALRAETAEVGVPDRIPAALRELPELPAGDEAGLDAVVSALLAPARSGILLTRTHLAVAARQRRLGVRLGDRRQTVRALLEQDAPAALAELAAQARTWAGRHHADAAVTGPIAGHWAARAQATSGLLIGRASAAGPLTHDQERNPR
ncbi:MAG TPA: molecular chaperone TorD family protein [Micromonosporaceae bacterium]